MAVKEWFRRLQPVQLYIVLFFTTAFCFVEILTSQFTHSLTLLLNAYHMLCNIVALVGGIQSIKYGNQGHCRGDKKCNSVGNSSIHLSEKNGSTSSLPSNPKHSCSDRRMKNTFGWARIDILTMLVYCVVLASFCLSVFMEALGTLCHISHHDEMHQPILVMINGIVGIIVNALSFIIIGGYTFNQGLLLHVSQDMNVIVHERDLSSAEQRLAAPIKPSPTEIKRRPGFLAVFRDMLGCILIIIVSIMVYFTDAHIAKFIDPIVAIIAAVSLLILSIPHVRESCKILLQTIPDHMNIDSLKKELLAAFPGIVNVHDLHVWQLTAGKVVSTVHIIFLDPTVYTSISDQVTAFFVEMGITQVTIQPEFHKIKPNANDTDCLIRCRGKRCIESQCCLKDDRKIEIINHKVDKNLIIVNKKFMKKEIIQAKCGVDLRRFELKPSDYTEDEADEKLENTLEKSINYNNSWPEKSIYTINVDVNYSDGTDVEETPMNIAKS